ncbi:MAG: hypothetical protein AB1938_09940 [Myxococcota bacterium]
MILRNLSSEVQVLQDTDGSLKTVRPNALVTITDVVGKRALAHQPKVWAAESVLIPPPPPASSPPR